MCLLTGVSCTEEAGLKITGKVSPHIQGTFYGGVTDVMVNENPINFAYGAASLNPHMDMPFYESHPGLVILQCLRNDECVTGGESTIVDALAVVEKLRVTHPHHFSTLVKVPTTFHRIHYERDYPVHMVYRTPLIHLNGDGQIVKLRWSPQNDGPLQVPEEDVQPYYEAYVCLARALKDDQQFQIRHRLQPGDMLTVNNHRILHGRTLIQLNGGVRYLKSIYLNIDEFKSRLMVLAARFDPDYQPKQVLNHDFSFSTALSTTFA
jgi:gamma-butyrobetaine dioxygenase